MRAATTWTLCARIDRPIQYQRPDTAAWTPLSGGSTMRPYENSKEPLHGRHAPLAGKTVANLSDRTELEKIVRDFYDSFPDARATRHGAAHQADFVNSSDNRQFTGSVGDQFVATRDASGQSVNVGPSG